MVALEASAEATTPVGAFGAPELRAVEAAEAGEVPIAVVAVTVKVYEVPLVRPVTMQLVVADVQVRPPGLEVTV